jgi:serine/threonine protein kinase/ABC-type phosphate/phosphonate transport system substrate-binding protein
MLESCPTFDVLSNAQERVIGKYRVVREIGRGGVGVVYEAENTWTHRRVALKVLSGSAAADTPSRERFLREARTAGRLVHPNVVAMIDADMEKDGSIYIVQELLVGEDLDTKLEREGPFTPRDIAAILLPVMDALASAHAAGIVHRDVKPSNVFLTQVGKRTEPKLIDFGLSKLVGHDVRITTQGMVIGTPAYMSPEQFFEPETVDHRSDLWAMAVMWFECLTGQLPFDGRSPTEIAARVVGGKRPPLRSLAPKLPAALVEAIERGLVHDRDARWQSASDMRAALARAIGAPSPSVPPPPSEAEIDIDIDIDVELERKSRPEPASLPVAPVVAARAPVAKPKDPGLSTANYGAARALLKHGLRAIRFGVVSTAIGFDDPSVGEALAKPMGVPVVVLRFGGYDELLEALRERRIEAAWTSPVAFVRASAARLARGSLSVLRGGQTSYVSVLLGHRDRVATLDARTVRGKRAAWVDRWSAGGYLMPRRILRERGLDPNTLLRAQASVMSYEAVLDCLRAGTADLGGIFGWRNPDGSVWHLGAKDTSLAVLAVSDPIPSDVLAMRADLPEDVGDVIAGAFARARPEDPSSRSLLAALSADGFARFDPSRYAWIAQAVREDENAADGPKANVPMSAEVSDLDWE